MAVRYVKDFEFPSAAGYSKSTPSKVTGQMLAKGGAAKPPKGMMVVIGIGKPKGPMKKADGGDVDAYGYGQGAMTNADRAAMSSPNQGMMTDAMRRTLMLQAAKKRAMLERQQGQGAMTDSERAAMEQMAGNAGSDRGYKKGGKVAKVMHEFGKGELHSGSKKGPKVTNPKQAIAIALSEQRASKKAKGGLESEDGSPLKSVPVKDIKSGKIPQSTDEDYYGKAKPAPMPPRRPQGLKKGGMAHEDVAADKSLIKSMVKPGALKKADGGAIPADVLSRYAAAKAAPQGPLSKYTLDDGRSVVAERQTIAPSDRPALRQMGFTPGRLPAGVKSVPVASRAPVIPQQAAAPGGQRIGVNAPRPGGPNVGAIRAAMARKASQAMPENSPGMMKKGGKVNC